MRECKDCRWFSWGVPDELRKKWQHSNFGKHCDGICSLYFPRGYIGREPPHAAMSIGHCFQWEEKDQIEFEFNEEERAMRLIDKKAESADLSNAERRER